jgi:nicotinamidase-related amidase
MMAALNTTAKVISAAHRFREPRPVLVLFDLQKLHLGGSRPYAVKDASSVMEGCKRLLTAARRFGIPIAHTKRVEADACFNPESPLTSWVEECRPTPYEMIYEHTAPSAYSVETFSRFFDHVQSPLIVLAGFGANYTGLATAIDGFSRGHQVWFVNDASGSYDGNASISHAPVCSIISQFAEVTDLETVLSAFEGQSRGRRIHG